MKTEISILLLSLFFVSLIACERDENVDNKPIMTGDILIVTSLPNSDGESGSAYMQLIDDLSPKTYTNDLAIPVSYLNNPIIQGNNVYVLPGKSNETTDYMKKYKHVNSQLEKQGELILPEQSGATCIIEKGDKAYVSLLGLGKILVINHQSMTKIGEIDISSYGVGDQNPDPGIMLIRDGLIYVGLNQKVGGSFPAQNRPYSDILIIDTETDEVVKMITEKITNISMPAWINEPNSIFMDENNDIYIVCLGAWGAKLGHKAGILRIKSGETEFDEDYHFVFNDKTIQNCDYNLKYTLKVVYAGNGKLYATANIPAYESTPPNYIEDRSFIAVEIDLASQTIKKLPLPRSTPFGTVGKYKSELVFGLVTSVDNGFYTYNPNADKASTNAIIKTIGYPYMIKEFK